MSKKKVALVLSHMAEQVAPGNEINLWPALQTRLANAPLQTSPMPHVSRGSRMNKNLISSNHLRFCSAGCCCHYLCLRPVLDNPPGAGLGAKPAALFYAPGERLYARSECHPDAHPAHAVGRPDHPNGGPRRNTHPDRLRFNPHSALHHRAGAARNFVPDSAAFQTAERHVSARGCGRSPTGCPRLQLPNELFSAAHPGAGRRSDPQGMGGRERAGQNPCISRRNRDG